MDLLALEALLAQPQSLYVLLDEHNFPSLVHAKRWSVLPAVEEPALNGARSTLIRLLRTGAAAVCGARRSVGALRHD